MATLGKRIATLFGRRLKAQPDPKSLPGTRVYHEYFVAADPDAQGNYPWMARVYAHTPTPSRGAGTAESYLVDQSQGLERSRDAARKVALAWAEKRKTEVRS